MTKHIKTWIATAAFYLIAIAILFFSYNGTRYTFIITTEEAMTRIDQALEKQAERDHALSFTSVNVKFVENVIQVNASVVGSLKGRHLQADAYAVGTPEYRDGAFYFHPTLAIRLENIKMSKDADPEGFFSKTRARIAGKIKDATSAFIAKHDWTDVLESFKIEAQQWISAKAQVAVAGAFAQHPIYRLKNDFKGIAISAVLEKVEVVDGTLHITLSLAQFAYTVFIAALILLCVTGVVTLLLFCPELAAAIGLIGSIGA